MDSLNMSKLNLSSAETPEFFPFEDEPYQCAYREEIWENLLIQESQKTRLQLTSPQLEFRGALVQQLRTFCQKLNLSMATLHSAVSLLDAFMDAHQLRPDRLTHITLTCLSLAAKSEERLSRIPTLKQLSKAGGVQICRSTFRQLEWMVGQHVRWRLLTPTVVSFASLLAQYVVSDTDVMNRHPNFIVQYRKDGVRLLEEYVDLTISNVHVNKMDSACVACACVACARADVGLAGWPAWLASIAKKSAAHVLPVARRLQRMMQLLKSRDVNPDLELDQGYCSSINSPERTPDNSPCSKDCSGQSSSGAPDNVSNRLTSSETNSVKVNSANDYRYCVSQRLLNSETGSFKGLAVKRGADVPSEYELKRSRLL